MTASPSLVIEEQASGIVIFEFQSFDDAAMQQWEKEVIERLELASARKQSQIIYLWDLSPIGDKLHFSSNFKKAIAHLLTLQSAIQGRVAIVLPDMEASGAFAMRIMQLYTRTRRSKRLVKVFFQRDKAMLWLEEVI
jgi:hypothetical protein